MLKYTVDGYIPQDGYCCFHISYFVFADSDAGIISCGLKNQKRKCGKYA